MTVRKRKWRDRKGRVRERWIIHIEHTHSDGKRQTIRRVSPIQTRRGAEKYERELRAQLHEEPRGEEQPKPAREVPTLAGFVEEFMAFQASPAASRKGPNKPGVITEKRRVLNNHLIPAFGRKRLDAISTMDIDRYVARKHASGLSTSSITNHLTVLKRMLNVAKRWEIIDRVPEIHTPKKPCRSDYLSTAESEALVAEVPDWWRPVVLLALRTGLRLGELRGLRWTDVDLDRARVRVEQNVTDAGIGTPKSGKGRTVPLAADILEVLRELRPTRASGLVFARDDGSPFGRTTILRMLDRAAKRADLCTTRKSVTVHLLRHSFASQAVLAGVPIRVVQAWLGHSEINQTMRYAHLSPDDHHGMIERLVPQ